MHKLKLVLQGCRPEALDLAAPAVTILRGGVKVTHYALSLKQPWAALLVHGLKSIEVRRWAAARRASS